MIAGVIAEFNPFHLGHKYQVDNISDEYLKIALISANLVQRAEVSFISVKSKIYLAMNNGYDLVVQIPDIYSFQNAQVFCTKSTQILSRLNVKYHYFGAEDDDINKLSMMKENIDNDKLKMLLKKGYSYNKANSIILSDIYMPNNILAAEYIDANRKYNLNLEQRIIKRNMQFMSASEIRKRISEGQTDLAYFNDYEINPNCNDKLFDLFKYIYLTHKNESIYDLTEQINNFIYNKVKISNNYTEFINNCTKKNISISRIKRLMLNIILNIKDYEIEYNMTDEPLKILASNKKGLEHLKTIDNYCTNYSKMYDYESRFLKLYDYLGIKNDMKNILIV